MRPRPVVLGAALLILALGAAGCTSSVSSGTSPVNHPAGGAGGASGRPATGTVVVKRGNKVVCVIKLTAGRGSCKVSTKNYPPGTVAFTGTYSGGSGFKPSKATANLKLTRAS